MGWLVATIVMAIDSALGAMAANIKLSQIQAAAKKVADQISADRAVVNSLHQAYIQKDAKLASSIIGASPFGNFYRNTINETKKNDQDIKDTTDEIERINKAETDLNNHVVNESTKHQTSGSAIVDLIGGTAFAPIEDPSYETSKYNKGE